MDGVLLSPHWTWQAPAHDLSPLQKRGEKKAGDTEWSYNGGHIMPPNVPILISNYTLESFLDLRAIRLYK